MKCQRLVGLSGLLEALNCPPFARARKIRRQDMLSPVLNHREDAFVPFGFSGRRRTYGRVPALRLRFWLRSLFPYLVSRDLMSVPQLQVLQ